MAYENPNEYVTCPFCEGTGILSDGDCRYCDSTGEMTEEQYKYHTT